MPAKSCLLVGETLLWLSAFICHSFAANATNGALGNSAHQPPDHASMISDPTRPNSANRVLTQCQVICQVIFCWDLCERTAENGDSHMDKVFPRIKRHAMSFGASRDTRPSSAYATAAAAEDVSSGSGGGTESLSSVRDDYVSGQPRGNSGRLAVESTSAGHARRSPGNGNGPLTVGANMSVKVGLDKSDELYGELYFRWNSQSNWSNRTVQIHWASETCNLNPRFPYCKEPNRYQNYEMLADANKWMKYRFGGTLMFNAKYWVTIELGQESSPQFNFTTPGCYRKDKQNPRKCALPLGFIPNKDSPNSALRIRLLCVAYDDGGDSVVIDVQWRVEPRPEDRWNSTVLVLLMPDRNPFLTKLTDRQETRLKLMVNHPYEIMVSAKSKECEIVYEPLIFNASVEKLKRQNDRPRCLTPTNISVPVPKYDGSNGVLIGSLVLVSVSMAGVVFFVYRKCRGVHMSKMAISEANSYKSSPSGSLRLLREGQPLNPNVDEWEIDPREVALGVEIGQGAFGRVLTGFYRDKEVAIKVLRENIPEFYREDLLREICLMKGLGYHPNIVTMLGACTVREPIALIVEYMPFGNLQTFLKKCRLDRETQTPEKRGEMFYCLLDEMTGVKESWQIAPNDILSFARQVVLAMQYLADRHYVHRDLAARNVLLGNNKVVKVCDFGLARMVYTGDQYFKLTSGRLPLKWMALESIRDRVFTTYSDVWSFGVLLWEMVTMGASPYPGIALVDLYRLLAEGFRMQQPVNCSDELYDIISQCWCENPTDRPTFARIRNQLEALLAKNVDYLDLDNIDIPLNHSGKEDVNDSDAKDRLLTTHDDVCIC